MKELTFTKQHNLSRLHDELLSIPALRPVVGTSGRNEAVIRVEGKDDVITLSVPDDADEGQIGAVVSAHVYVLPPPPPDFRALAQSFRTAVNNASTVAMLKAALSQELMLLLRAMAQNEVKDL